MTDTVQPGATGTETPPQPLWRRASVSVAAVAALSLVVRLLVMRDLYRTDPLLLSPVLDDAAYLDVARAMAEGTHGAWFLAPLHPWIAARLSSVFTLDLGLLGAVNLVAGVLTSGLLVLGGRRLGPPLAGWIAGLLHALLGSFVFHDVLPGQEPLLGLLHVATFLAGASLLERGRRRDAGAIGLLTGIAMLGRGTSLGLLLVALPGLMRSDRRRGLVGALALGLVLALVPASIRNLSVAGTASPLPWSGGPNAYLANGPDARATRSMTATSLGGTPGEIAEIAVAVARDGGADGPYETSSFWLRKTWQDRGSVLELAAHVAAKSVLFWSAEERGSNHDLRAERDYSPGLRVLPASTWWVLGLALGAWWLLRTRRREADVAALGILGTWILLSVFFPVARYRLPATALALTLVGGAVPIAVTVWQSERRRAFVALALVGASVVVAFLPVREWDRGGGHVNLAAAMKATGASNEAVLEQVERAIEVAPKNGPARELMGRFAMAQGDAGAALEHFRIAAFDRRTRFSAQVLALPALLSVGRVAEADRAARGLLGEQPNDPQALAFGAVVSRAVGREDEARARLARAQAIAPDHPAVRLVAGRLRDAPK